MAILPIIATFNANYIGQKIGQGVRMSRDDRVSFPGGYEQRQDEFIDPDTRTISEGWTSQNYELDKRATSFGPMREEFEPEKLPPISGPVTLRDGTVIRPMPQRGGVLHEAINIINGERQDVYGSPEDSFAKIADYWTTYLGDQMTDRITAEDVALMMTLFKIAREANQHKRDNIIDAAGYLGIYADMQGAK